MKKPTFKIELCLTKKDSLDFDRTLVSQLLDKNPTETKPPKISKGRLVCDDLAEAKKDFKGHTIIESPEAPYQYINHAFWCFECNPIETYDLCDAFQEFKSLFNSKIAMIKTVLSDFNLFLDVIIHVYANANDMPIISMSVDDIAFLNDMNAEVSFDFHLD